MASTKKITINNVEFVVPINESVMSSFIDDWVRTQETCCPNDGIRSIQCICDGELGCISCELFKAYVQTITHKPRINLTEDNVKLLDTYIKMFHQYAEILTHLKDTLTQHAK